jgi:glycosyltransferase involved in cell wall biosynthesis
VITPLVSAVIIFLDAERFLDEAVESVLAQTFTDWELVLVDDGSTDRSTAIARQWAAAHPGRVRYVEHPGHANRGMSASRNLGIRSSRGPYVALLDADDVWLPAKLEQQVALLEAHPGVAMVYGPTQWWYGWTGRPEDERRDFVHHLGVEPGQPIAPPTLLVRLLRDEGISPCTCSMLVRRRVLERVGGFEESFRGLYEDQALCAKICLEWPVLASNDCSYRYRQHADSACAVAEREGSRQATRLVFLDWLSTYLRQHGGAYPEVSAALERERRRVRAASRDGLLGRVAGTRDVVQSWPSRAGAKGSPR